MEFKKETRVTPIIHKHNLYHKVKDNITYIFFFFTTIFIIY